MFYAVQVQQLPTFTHKPGNMSLLVGQNAKIMCAATGFPPPVMKWAKDGGSSFPAAIEHRLYVKPNDDHLYVMNVSVEDQVKYYILYKITYIYIYIYIYINTYIWTKDNESLFVDGERTVLKAQGQILLIQKAQLSDTGQYVCELWADNDQLARQTTSVYVERYTSEGTAQNAKLLQIKYDKGMRLLPVPLIIALLRLVRRGSRINYSRGCFYSWICCLKKFLIKRVIISVLSYMDSRGLLSIFEGREREEGD
uniref:Ig-like domain-containing protein n=1 Tax=Heterorhabditis bacteriophora TaxID=37862 RepID=A0A1I7XBR2_HETBA